MWNTRKKVAVNSNMVEHLNGELRKNAPYKDDYIMENGVKLTLRTYISESTIKIPGYNSVKIYGGDVIYLLNNKLHRINGPAFIRKHDLYIWLKDGKLHRDGDMPAVENESGNMKIYCKDGYFHRENGPAIYRRMDGFTRYYIDDKQITIDELSKDFLMQKSYPELLPSMLVYLIHHL